MATVEGVDRSTHPTVVEYAVRDLFKGKSPAAAAKHTVKKLSGFENLFLGPGVAIIDARMLEIALWDRMAAHVIAGLNKVRAGKEDYALDGTIQFYTQKPNVRERLRELVVEKLGRDPFPPDLSPNNEQRANARRYGAPMRQPEYYIWTLNQRGEPVGQAIAGPHPHMVALSTARDQARKSALDRAVSIGAVPTAPGFRIMAVYEARTGRKID